MYSILSARHEEQMEKLDRRVQIAETEGEREREEANHGDQASTSDTATQDHKRTDCSGIERGRRQYLRIFCFHPTVRTLMSLNTKQEKQE